MLLTFCLKFCAFIDAYPTSWQVFANDKKTIGRQDMSSLAMLHSSRGARDFLGLRRNRTGGLEIVHVDGADRRTVWRVESRCDPQPISDALRAALDANRVLPALFTELKKRAITVEQVI